MLKKIVFAQQNGEGLPLGVVGSFEVKTHWDVSLDAGNVDGLVEGRGDGSGKSFTSRHGGRGSSVRGQGPHGAAREL